MKEKVSKLVPELLSRFIKEVVLYFRKYYYKGTDYYCPVCDNSFRQLLTGGFDLKVIKEKEIIGAGRRPNIICPFCQSTDRDRLVYYYLSNKIDIYNSQIKVLHIAPEPALYKFLRKRKNLNYITGTKYSEGIYFHKDIDSMDLLDLPFKNEEFDLFISNHVLEHINDDAKAMSEIFRVIKKNGIAILQVPISYKIKSTYEDSTITDERLREEHFGQFDHVRIYGRDYIDRLENAGFKVTPYSAYDDHKNNGKLEKVVLNHKEKLFVVHKEK